MSTASYETVETANWVPMGRRQRRSTCLTLFSGRPHEEPGVRIHLPPADSLSLSRFCFRTLRTRLSARVWAAGLTTGSAETRQAFHCAPTGGNVSAGPYSSTAVPLMRSVQCHDGLNEARTRA